MGVIESYFLYFIIMMLSARSLKAISKFRRNGFNRNARIIFSFAIIFSLTALRYFNNDMKGYTFYIFDNYVRTVSSLKALLSSHNYLEPIYWTLYYVSKMLTGEVWLFIIITSFIMCFFYYKAIIYEESTHNVDMMFMLLFSSLFMGFYSGLRQGMACAIFAFAFRYILERKLTQYVLWIIIAGCIHKSGFTLLILYPLINFPGKRIYKYLAIVMGYLIISTSSYFLNLIGDVYGTVSNTNSVLSVLVSIIVDIPFLVLYVAFYRDMEKYLPNIEAYMILYVMSFAINATNSLFSFGRINWYLSFANVVLMPVCISVLADKMTRRSRRILKILFILYCGFYLYRTAASWGCLPYQTWLQFL